MSVQAISPFSGSKRLFEEHSEDIDSSCDRGQGKRGRFVAGSPSSGRCSGPGPSFQAVHPATIQALKGLFPGMDDQAVTAVLAECGNDIDAAIQRLNQLRIAAGEQQAQQQEPQQQAQQQPQQQAQQGQGQQQQQQPQEQQQQQQRQAGPSPPNGQQEQAAAAAAAAAGPQTAEQWVDALVGEMSQATNIPDARARAGKLLQAFEHFVGARAAPAPPQLQARLEEAQRENAILKRAVQIQNARMQEAASKEAELGALKQVVAQYQERLRHLELSNYSLALHLQKATGDAPVAPGHRPPDVY